MSHFFSLFHLSSLALTLALGSGCSPTSTSVYQPAVLQPAPAAAPKATCRLVDTGDQLPADLLNGTATPGRLVDYYNSTLADVLKINPSAVIGVRYMTIVARAITANPNGFSKDNKWSYLEFCSDYMVPTARQWYGACPDYQPLVAACESRFSWVAD